MSEIKNHKILYVLTAECSAQAVGVTRAIAEAVASGELILAYIHDPQHEERLREALSSGAFVGLKQIDVVTDAASKSTEACGLDTLNEAQKKAEASGVTVIRESLHGPLVQQIVALAQKHSPDKIVLSRPKSGFLARIFGPKITKKIQREVRVPIEAVSSD